MDRETAADACADWEESPLLTPTRVCLQMGHECLQMESRHECMQMESRRAAAHRLDPLAAATEVRRGEGQGGKKGGKPECL